MGRRAEKRSGAVTIMGKEGPKWGEAEGPCEKGREGWSWCPRREQVTQRRL